MTFLSEQPFKEQISSKHSLQYLSSNRYFARILLATLNWSSTYSYIPSCLFSCPGQLNRGPCHWLINCLIKWAGLLISASSEHCRAVVDNVTMTMTMTMTRVWRIKKCKNIKNIKDMQNMQILQNNSNMQIGYSSQSPQCLWQCFLFCWGDGWHCHHHGEHHRGWGDGEP